MKKYFYIFIAQLFSGKKLLADGLLDEGVAPIRDQTDAFRESSGMAQASENTISEIVASLIKVFLGFLGIIFIVLILWAGYNWMTAGGNEEKVSKARTTIYRAMIGLVIILSAYAITYFVFGALEESTTGP